MGKRIVIEGENVRLKGRNIIVKRGYFWFEYETYEQVKDDDAGLNRFYYYSHIFATFHIIHQCTEFFKNVSVTQNDRFHQPRMTRRCRLKPVL